MIVNESVLSLGISLLALFIAGLLATRVNQSMTAVFIVVGMILQNFFPVTIVTEFIATLGIIFMLFMFGLEFSVGSLVNNQQKIFFSGIYDLIFNFPLGLLIGWLLGYDLIQSLLLAGIIYVTSSVIVAKSIIDLKRSANPETEYILNVLIFEDMFIAAFLAFIIDIEHTELFVILILSIIVRSVCPAFYFAASGGRGALRDRPRASETKQRH